MMLRKLTLLVSAFIILTLGFVYFGDTLTPLFFEPTDTALTDGELGSDVSEPSVVVSELAIPWELVFLPDGEMLVTERAGKLLIIGEDRHIIEVQGVAHRGEGGLLGLTLHPDFSKNNWLYLYLTTSEEGGLTNRVERYALNATTLTDRTVIIENIPGASYHDGGRIAFGPDDMLYITTGDAGVERNAQNTQSLAGKILRVNPDGSIPSDNPFGNAVYSYGHRNVQGIAWDENGNLFATEHGRSGLQSGFDEVNRIVKGGNYGWPDIQGDETKQGMISPVIHSGPTETWAPSGMARLNNHLIFAGLRGESLYAAELSDGDVKNLTAYLREEYGRLRTVTVGSDGMLYALTNNRDGRGHPAVSDDRVIRLDPRSFGI